MSVAAELPGMRRRRGARVAAGALAVIAAGAGAWIAFAPDGDGGTQKANDAVPLGSAVVQRRDLIDQQTVDGTLGYAGDHAVAAPAAGTITRLRAEGDVVRRGRSLLSIDAKATGWVLYGRRPMYRDLGPGVTDGSDVRQLERNLKALGYDPGTVDTDWTSATTAAVKAFQDDRGLDETGTLKRSDVVISDGPARVGAHKAEVGDPARAGGPVTELTTTTPVVTAKLDASLAPSVRRGDAVDITLPDGRSARGRISEVGTVATPGQDGAPATVALEVSLKGHRHGRFDGAPVSLVVATGHTRNALSVPVTALVATAPSTYAVQLAGSKRLVPVQLGAFAGGWVQVSGAGLSEGTRVVVPR